MDSFLFIFLFIIVYIVFLLAMKGLGFGKKEKQGNCMNSCPDCKNPLERIKRLNGDYLLNHLTFHIFNFKRYRCIDCFWEGLRWEKQFKPGRD